MKNKKVIGLLLSLALVLGLALPGTLAVSADAESTGTEFSVGTNDVNEQKTETPLEDANNSEGTLVEEESVQPDSENSSAASEDDALTAEEDSILPDDSQHEEGPSALIDDTESSDNSESALPEESDHVDACVDGCTGEGCDCPCHELSLFDRLMACETLDELFDIVDATPEEELLALTDEENAEIEAKIAALESEPLPPMVLEDCENESVISEIIYPAVNFDHVAPFGAPVEG